jgi:oxygen-dependent protoporphyrinogen oxidase
VSFLGGTEELPSALAAQIKTSVHLNRAVQAISRHDDGYSLLVGNETVQADAVVLAIPAQPAAALLRPLVPQAAGVLDELRTVSSGVIYLAYACDQIRHPLDGFGVVIPRIEKRNFNAITWVSSKFAHRVPTGHALIRLFFGGARTPHMMARSDAEIAQASCQELQQLMGIGAMPLFSQIFRWWDAQPQYDVGHLERMERIERSLPPGLALIGTAYQGVGIPDCVYQGRQAARRLVDTILNTLSPL